MATVKQKKAFKEVLSGSTISGAMLKAGYSETTSTTTGKLTNTVGWNELMQKHLPDSLLVKRHRELLNKREHIVVAEQKVDNGPDTMAVSKGLDMAYKLKGSYAPEKSQALNLNIKGDIKDFSELESVRLKYEEELKNKLIS